MYSCCITRRSEAAIAAKSSSGIAVRDDCIIHFEQHAEPVAFVGQLLAIALRAFVIECIVHGDRDLPRNLQHKIDFFLAISAFFATAERQRSELPLGGGQRQHAQGADAVDLENLAQFRKAFPRHRDPSLAEAAAFRTRGPLELNFDGQFETRLNAHRL